MEALSYRILLIGEDASRTQAYAQMLQEADDPRFEIEKETNWQSTLERFAMSAPDLPLPDAILWEPPASDSAAPALVLALVKDTTAQLHCVPLACLVPESQKQLGKQMCEAGASDYLVIETLNKDLLQRAMRYAIKRRQLENMVRRSQKLESNGMLSGGFAHDFNNLLCVINGHTEILTEALPPGDPALRSVTQIRKASDSAAALTRRLLAFNRRAGEINKGTETILVVEDAEPLRVLTTEFLAAIGYTVLEAANGDEAMQVAQSYPGSIDLLLTDVVMPRMGGQPLVEQMAQIRPHTRVLYMSGYPNDGIVHAGILPNGVTLLEKPFTREILSKRVRQVLDAPARAT